MRIGAHSCRAYGLVLCVRWPERFIILEHDECRAGGGVDGIAEPKRARIYRTGPAGSDLAGDLTRSDCVVTGHLAILVGRRGYPNPHPPESYPSDHDPKSGLCSGE